MKVIRLRSPGGLERLDWREEAEPAELEPGSIRVRLQASSLNYHDYGVVSGGMKVDDGRIPLSDGAGTVEAVGPSVSEFKPGDLVVSRFFPDWLDGPPVTSAFERTPGDGIDGYAREVIVAPAHWFTKAPRGWSPVEAATITTAGLTAWRALVVEGALKAGDTVLILGTGGVSIYALQLAKAMGAKVAITSKSDEKLERAKSLGADHGVNYRRHEDWGHRIVEWSGGMGVDHVLEVGGPATLGQSIRACRVGGHLVLIGVLTGIRGEVPTAFAMRKQLRIQGVLVGNRRQQLDLIRAVESTGIKPVIDRTFGFEQLKEAFEFEAAGRHFGKVGVQW